ncbi:MAG: MarC family protein [Syntrophobacter sp.]
MLSWTEYLKILIALTVIVNPIGVIPIFMSLTGHQPSEERKRTALISALAAGLVLIGACLLGDTILRFFGITIGSFRVGGGILLILLAVSMFHAKQDASKHLPEEEAEAGGKADIAVVPIAIPLLSGPGAISTVIIFSQQLSGPRHSGLIVIACLLVSVVVWITLRLAIGISAKLGKTGINIITRLMGLILAATAVEFIVSGLKELLPALTVTPM